jgi:organic hydroperoxide reductase OsmC/OhrA
MGVQQRFHPPMGGHVGAIQLEFLHMKHIHIYQINVNWTGNIGNGTAGYNAYERAHTIKAKGKPLIHGSSDPAFRGDNKRYNPEELFVASISSCHMLWYLHLCAENGIVVLSYQDNAIENMAELEDGSGYFTEVVLYPEVMVQTVSMVAEEQKLHDMAHKLCFIANSCNFIIRHEPVCTALSNL